MPDRYDPKLSVRPAGDRKSPDERGGPGPGADDPLVELARIVSGRSPFESAFVRSDKQNAAMPSASPAQPLPSEADLARDLEAELLNELQASFSTIPEIVGRPAPPQPTPPEPAQTLAPLAPPAARAAQPQVPATGYPKATPSSIDDLMDEAEFSPEILFRPPTATETAVRQQPAPPAAPRVEAQIRPPPAPPKRESLAARIARAAQGGEREEPPASPRMEQPEPPRTPAPPASPRVSSFRPPSFNARPETGNPQIRSTLAPNPPPTEPAAPPSRQAPSRWDPVPEQRPPALDAARFAPQGTDGFRPDAQEPREPAIARGLPAEIDPFAGDAPFPTVEETYFDEEPGNENFDMVPGYGDEELLPYPEDEAAFEPRRSRRGPVVIAALLTLVVIGGAAAVMLRSGGGDVTPPIITADATPTKVTPQDVGSSESDGQAKLIYDRVDPGTEVAESQLVVPGDDPIADIPPIPEDMGAGDVSRVILGGGPGFDPPFESPDPTAPIDLSEGMATTVESSTASDVEPIGPKKVRTVVVRPDGTIVSSAATAPEETFDAIPDLPPASETPPAPAAEENPLLADDFGIEAIDNPAPIEDPASASVPDIPAPPPATAAAPRTAPPPAQPTIVATTGGANGPIDLTPGTPSPQAATGGGGGFLVQVSSQRSQETAIATFRDLQRRYPGILGDRQPDIQRADLGQRGVYYRVRVGYPTRDQAVRMCENLKSAGGDCILATR